MTNPVTRKTPATGWFKSSYSNPAHSCVEVRFDGANVLVRDTKDCGTGPIITVPTERWAGFLAEAHGNAPAGSNHAVHIAHAEDGTTRLHAADTTLTYTPGEWTAFVAGVLVGEFDLPAPISR